MTEISHNSSINIIFPSQCSCGHIYLERYKLNPPNKDGVIGFCWCGFCRTRLNIFSDNSFSVVDGNTK